MVDNLLDELCCFGAHACLEVGFTLYHFPSIFNDYCVGSLSGSPKKEKRNSHTTYTLREAKTWKLRKIILEGLK